MQRRRMRGRSCRREREVRGPHKEREKREKRREDNNRKEHAREGHVPIGALWVLEVSAILVVVGAKFSDRDLMGWGERRGIRVSVSNNKKQMHVPQTLMTCVTKRVVVMDASRAKKMAWTSRQPRARRLHSCIRMTPPTITARVMTVRLVCGRGRVRGSKSMRSKEKRTRTAETKKQREEEEEKK